MKPATIIPFKGERIKSEGTPSPLENQTSMRVKKEVHSYMAPLDTKFVSRVQAIAEALVAEIGGQLTVQEDLLVRSIATYQAQLERYTNEWLYTVGDKDGLAAYESASMHLMGLLDRLYHNRPLIKPHPLGPTPMDIHRNKRP